MGLLVQNTHRMMSTMNFTPSEKQVGGFALRALPAGDADVELLLAIVCILKGRTG